MPGTTHTVARWVSGRGRTLNVASVTTASVPSEPMKSFIKS
jgi:hypothetical protein